MHKGRIIIAITVELKTIYVIRNGVLSIFHQIINDVRQDIQDKITTNLTKGKVRLVLVTHDFGPFDGGFVVCPFEEDWIWDNFLVDIGVTKIKGDYIHRIVEND